MPSKFRCHRPSKEEVRQLKKEMKEAAEKSQRKKKLRLEKILSLRKRNKVTQHERVKALVSLLPEMQRIEDERKGRMKSQMLEEFKVIARQIDETYASVLGEHALKKVRPLSVRQNVLLTKEDNTLRAAGEVSNNAPVSVPVVTPPSTGFSMSCQTGSSQAPERSDEQEKNSTDAGVVHMKTDDAVSVERSSGLQRASANLAPLHCQDGSSMQENVEGCVLHSGHDETDVQPQDAAEAMPPTTAFSAETRVFRRRSSRLLSRERKPTSHAISSPAKLARSRQQVSASRVCMTFTPPVVYPATTMRKIGKSELYTLSPDFRSVSRSFSGSSELSTPAPAVIGASAARPASPAPTVIGASPARPASPEAAVIGASPVRPASPTRFTRASSSLPLADRASSSRASSSRASSSLPLSSSAESPACIPLLRLVDVRYMPHKDDSIHQAPVAQREDSVRQSSGISTSPSPSLSSFSSGVAPSSSPSGSSTPLFSPSASPSSEPSSAGTSPSPCGSPSISPPLSPFFTSSPPPSTLQPIVWKGKGFGILCTRDPMFTMRHGLPDTAEPYMGGRLSGHVVRQRDHCGWKRVLVESNGVPRCWFSGEDEKTVRALIRNGYKVRIKGDWVSRSKKYERLGGFFVVWKAVLKWEVYNTM
ncbi:hypothetical protein BJ508DRAFT_333675 [Ascobolus immersus RN42]|uniref:Uncharacterized protein n=1 Tax=Ascobolus immersus RN42 TaxID=1160509 RepID=A0A3N4HIT1_ASCIM|nr:hypothetical protein BJ508DRAFT_333675 [Ascobolus immersus RN42]